MHFLIAKRTLCSTKVLGSSHLFYRYFVPLNTLRSKNLHFMYRLKPPPSKTFVLPETRPSSLFSTFGKPDPDKSDSKKIESVSLETSVPKVNQRTRLKQAVRDYGATIVVFHVAISLASLGVCYLAISNGVDAMRLLTFLGFSESVVSSKVAVGGSTFVISYAVHKMFAPVRIGITLSVAPFIVRYLRRIKWLKTPKT